MGKLAATGLGEVHAVASAQASRLVKIGTRLGEAAVLVDEPVPHVDIDDAGFVGAAAVQIVQEWNIDRRATGPQWRQADPESRRAGALRQSVRSRRTRMPAIRAGCVLPGENRPKIPRIT
jgi:hypothetical protein